LQAFQPCNQILGKILMRHDTVCFANLFASFVGNAVQNSHKHLHEQLHKVSFKGYCFARVILGPILCKNMKSPRLFIFLQGFQFTKDIQCKKYFAKLSYPFVYSNFFDFIQDHCASTYYSILGSVFSFIIYQQYLARLASSSLKFPHILFYKLIHACFVFPFQCDIKLKFFFGLFVIYYQITWWGVLS
jgi:hypothetical protein